MYIDTNGNPQETYFCTRPRLASLLMEKGYVGTRVVNPYHQERQAWTFPADNALMQIVSNYFVKDAYNRWDKRTRRDAE